jgi:inner membrane protein
MEETRMSNGGAMVGLWQLLAGSPVARLLGIAGLMLCFLLPIEWIASLVAERLQRRDDAVAEVSQKWGGAQRVVGPLLLVPYAYRFPQPVGGGEPRLPNETRILTVLPTELTVQAHVDAEERFRGIFAVPVYRAVLDVRGTFAAPDLRPLRIDPATVDWQHADLVVGLADAHAIQNRAAVRWNDLEPPFQSGAGASGIKSGIHAPLAAVLADAPARFAFELILNGSGGLYFTPVGEQTHVTVAADWPNPSFQGSWLPGERATDADGFRATWQIPFLGRNQPPAWTSETWSATDRLAGTVFGVDLATSVDPYRMAERSVKYARLFVFLTFGVIWLVEVMGRFRVHPIQYLLIGCALCTFYLLELSLAEQLGFAVAYALAGTAVAALVGGYAVAALRGRRRAALVTGTVAGLYGYLYVVLTEEDYALLLGSLGVFAAVAAAMLLTRRVDWYGRGRGADDALLDTP